MSDYEEAIRIAIRHGMDGEAILGIDSLIEAFPGLYNEIQRERNSPLHEQYMKLVAAIGPGFHPENRGEDYMTMPKGYSAQMYDDIVDAAWANQMDVFGLAEQALEGER